MIKKQFPAFTYINLCWKSFHFASTYNLFRHLYPIIKGYRQIFSFHCKSFLMSHFLQAAVLSAWTWQMYLFAPCFLSLHSHSMTNVKRISSLHESSHSTRTKRVSRMAVIQTVSKLTDTHVPHSESQCRSHDRGFTGVFQGQRLGGGRSCSLSRSFLVVFVFLLFLLDHSQRYSGSDADPPAGVKPSQYCSFSGDMSPYGHIVRPSFPPENLSSVWTSLCHHVVFGPPCWLLSVWAETGLLLMLRLSLFLSFFCSGSLWTANRTSWG